VPPAPEPDGRSTARERAAAHQAAPECRGCHLLLDPIGLAFETYDAIGRWQTSENGKPIDPRGRIHGLPADELEGDARLGEPFTGVAELGRALAASARVSGCFAAQWFRFSHGRVETDADACSLAEVEALLARSGFRLSELLVALTQTDAFLYRRPGGAP
jgi:hypothetical protein